MKLRLPSRRKIWEWITRKVREWTTRYGPQELCGLSAALVVAMLNRNALLGDASFDMALVLYQMTVADAAVYYTYGFVREWLRYKRTRPATNILLHVVLIIRDMFSEYWFVDIVDTTVTRPGCMFIALRLTHGLFTGVIIGHAMAGIIFNVVVVPFYELRKRMFRDRSRRTP